MQILVSVRDLDEARLAAQAGVAFIDLKEPAGGALGGLPPARIAPIVDTLRAEAPTAIISATIGDLPAEVPDLGLVRQRCLAVAACGVDHVKVGVSPGAGATALLQGLGTWRAAGLPIVPVLLADDGVPWPLLDAALATGCAALMLDTADKHRGSLLEACPAPDLARFVGTVQARGVLAGLAGALRRSHLPALAALRPDFAGFRSAVCAGARHEALDEACLAALLAAVSRATREALPTALPAWTA
jgi:(5-formylfuran-3-yl)methyl phosphate synthase